MPAQSIVKRPTSSLIPGAKNTPNKAGKDKGDTDYNTKEKGYPLTFTHLGKRGYVVPLFAGSAVQRRKWIEHIETQQSVLRERSSIFTMTVLCEGQFNTGNRVNCLVPIGMHIHHSLSPSMLTKLKTVAVNWCTEPIRVFTCLTGRTATTLLLFLRRLSKSTRSTRLMSSRNTR